MTAYALEFVLASLAIGGAILVMTEFWFRRDWTMVGFFIVFAIPATWFAIAGFRTVAFGEPDWLFNRSMSYAVRIPLVITLYVVAWRLRVKRNGRQW